MSLSFMFADVWYSLYFCLVSTNNAFKARAIR